MISQLEVQKRNLESSLLFMQQEHSNTLKALHGELSKLQKRCTELTFQLAMQSSPQDLEEDRAKQIEELTKLLKDSETKRIQHEKELELKDSSIKQLHEQTKSQERKLVEELKRKSKQLVTLQADLDSKSGTIAYLTTEMHKLKVQHQTDSESSASVELRLSRQSSPSQTELHVSTSSRDIARRPVTAKKTANYHDTQTFLIRPPMDSNEVMVKPSPPVLPPIRTGEQQNHIIRQRMVRRRIDIQQPTTFAVDQLASSSSTYVHEPHTYTE